MGSFFNKKHNGLTLIEVMIALVIVSIAFSALLITNASIHRNTRYIQNKMMAAWVGSYVMNAIQIGLIHAPSSNSMTMLGQSFNWNAELEPADEEGLQTLSVSVKPAHENQSLIQWECYVYNNKA